MCNLSKYIIILTVNKLYFIISFFGLVLAMFCSLHNELIFQLQQPFVDRHRDFTLILELRVLLHDGVDAELLSVRGW